MFTNLAYYIIRCYTFLVHYFYKFIILFNLEQPQQVDKLELIYNNNSKEICKNELVIISPIQYNFIKYSNKNAVSIYFTAPSPNSFEQLQYTCSYKFISVSIYIKKIDFHNNIDLKGYFIVGNKINNYVICYLLKMQYNIICDATELIYVLTIIDQNVTIFNIDETKTIIFDLNNYSIT